MLKRYLSIIFIGVITQSCSAENKHPTSIELSVGSDAKLFFSSHYYEDQNLLNRNDFKNLIKLDWFEPYDVKDSSGSMKSIKNCHEFLINKDDYSEAITSEYSTFRYYLMHCLAMEKIIESKDSEKSFLPNQLVSEESPNILPKEFIPVVSKSDREALDAMLPSARWIDGIKLIKNKDLGNKRIMFSQEGQKQILSELARADFNDDGIEDSLVYLRTTLDGGSWESDVIITVTAGEDGVIRMIDVYPND